MSKLSLLTPFWGSGVVSAMEPDEAARIAKQHLASDDDDERKAARTKKHAQYGAEIEPVLSKLRARSFDTVKHGYLPKEHFTAPKLLEEYPAALRHFN